MRLPGRTPAQPSLRRHGLGLRRLLSAGLVAAATAVGLHVLAPAPPGGVAVVVAAHDIAAGHRIGATDLRVARWAPGTSPPSATSDPAAAIGRVSSGPLPRGTAVVEADLLGPGLLSGQEPGLLAVPVRLADSSAAGLVRRGDRVDLIAASAGTAVVTDVVVLADPGAGSSPDSLGVDSQGSVGSDTVGSDSLGSGSTGSGSLGSAALDGATVVVGVWLGDAVRLAKAEATGPLTLAVHPH